VTYHPPVLAVFLIALTAHGATKPKKPPEPAPAPAPPAPAQPAGPDLSKLSEAQLLDGAHEAFKSLEYDRALPLTEKLLEREGATFDQRIEAYFLLASARAFVTDPLEAERPLRALLRLKPDFELPPDTSPKLVAVFRKVQVEEAALAAEAKATERARVRSRIKLEGGPPATAVGGQPLTFRYRATDPLGSIAVLRVSYRNGRQGEFSALALERAKSGDWEATLPGDATASETPWRLEYYVEALDGLGPLAALGGEMQPRVIDVEAGQVPRPFKPLSRAFYAGVIVLAAAATATTAVVGGRFASLQAHFAAITRTGTVDGAEYRDTRLAGFEMAQATNWSLIVTVVLAAATVVLPILVDWNP
jgi:hypothetical protein